MGRKSMPPFSSQPESVKAKLGMALSCAPALTVTPTATEAISTALHSKDLLNISCSLSGVVTAGCIPGMAIVSQGICRANVASVVVSKFATFPYRSPSELRNQNDTRNQYVASVLSIPKFAKRRYRDVVNFGIGTIGGRSRTRDARAVYDCLR